jgi:DNA-binding CsgD family transcriptional regulator
MPTARPGPAVPRSVPPDCPLTRRQWAALSAVCEGLTQKQTARRLGVEVSTVRSLLHGAYRALDVRTAVQAALVAIHAGWLGAAATPEPDEQITPFQRAYLAAFDDHLRTGSSRSRATMRIALYGARHAVGLTPRPEQEPERDGLDRVVGALLGAWAVPDRRAA